jgi:hypothetical protein
VELIWFLELKRRSIGSVVGRRDMLESTLSLPVFIILINYEFTTISPLEITVFHRLELCSFTDAHSHFQLGNFTSPHPHSE